MFLLSLLFLWAFSIASCLAGPSVSQIDNTVLDNNGIFFVSYDGVVNVNSFHQSASTTFNGYEYAGWYSSNSYAMLARRQLPSGSWSTLQLPHTLSTKDSHNVVAIGISPSDGVIHVAMDCHSTRLYYAASEAGLATNPSRSWVASRFGAISSNLGNLNIGSTITYPQWLVTPDNKLQFVYRTGVSGNGNAQIAEYNGGGSFSNIGIFASASGTYTSTNGATSTARNLYIHGLAYDSSGRLHASGTWREQNSAVMCNSGGLTNHDTVYFYSDDRGRTWYNSVKTKIATTGSSPVNVNTAGIIVDPLNADHALMNQESQSPDSTGQPHIIISYVPGRFGQCVSSYASGRTANGYAFHVFRNSAGTWTKTEIPFALGAVGRSQIVIDSHDNVYVVLPYARIVSASKSSGYTDWTMAWDGKAQGLNVFGEITLDRSRVKSEGIVGIFYQKNSSGSTPSAVGLTHFKLNG